tara:strand:- start:2560 stop:2958 length:399 start_codon:yes stop_codon:yes gene_type:complete
MSDWFEWMSFGQKALSFVIMALGALTTVGVWFWARVDKRVKSGVSGLTVGHKSIEKRLEAVEGSVGTMHADMDRVRSRLSTIETKVSQLATSKDLHDLAVLVARFGATQEAQANMTRMLYEAAQRAEKSGGK